MSAIIFAYCPRAHAMSRVTLPDVAVNDAIDAYRAQGADVSVCWLSPDPTPTADELLDGLSFENVRGE